MKNMMLAIFLATVSLCAAQNKLPMPEKNGAVTYEEVVEVPLTKEQIYAKVKLWFAESFKSANDVIQADDKENGIIMGKGVSAEGANGFRFRFSMKVQMKDNRYKVEITNIVTVFGGADGPAAEAYNKESSYNAQGKLRFGMKMPIEHIDSQSRATLESLKAYISKKAEDF